MQFTYKMRHICKLISFQHLPVFYVEHRSGKQDFCLVSHIRIGTKLILKGFYSIYVTTCITEFLKFVHYIVIKETLNNRQCPEIL
jgi:hypothetical protein